MDAWWTQVPNPIIQRMETGDLSDSARTAAYRSVEKLLKYQVNSLLGNGVWSAQLSRTMPDGGTIRVANHFGFQTSHIYMPPLQAEEKFLIVRIPYYVEILPPEGSPPGTPSTWTFDYKYHLIGKRLGNIDCPEIKKPALLKYILYFHNNRDGINTYKSLDHKLRDFMYLDSVTHVPTVYRDAEHLVAWDWSVGSGTYTSVHSGNICPTGQIVTSYPVPNGTGLFITCNQYYTSSQIVVSPPAGIYQDVDGIHYEDLEAQSGSSWVETNFTENIEIKNLGPPIESTWSTTIMTGYRAGGGSFTGNFYRAALGHSQYIIGNPWSNVYDYEINNYVSAGWICPPGGGPADTVYTFHVEYDAGSFSCTADLTWRMAPDPLDDNIIKVTDPVISGTVLCADGSHEVKWDEICGHSHPHDNPLTPDRNEESLNVPTVTMDGSNYEFECYGSGVPVYTPQIMALLSINPSKLFVYVDYINPGLTQLHISIDGSEVIYNLYAGILVANILATDRYVVLIYLEQILPGPEIENWVTKVAYIDRKTKEFHTWRDTESNVQKFHSAYALTSQSDLLATNKVAKV